MSYKTLILIDNCSEMTTLNREIVKATLKYFISNYDSENKIAIAVTGENAEYLTDYDDTISTQLKTIEGLNFTEINAPGTDALMEVILDWKEGDLADRDIIYVGCREMSINSDYTQEELLFEVNGKQYPVYTLACAQNENTSFLKSMNVLSRISGGECVTTEDAKADAEVEKQLSDKLMNEIFENRRIIAENYEAKGSIGTQELTAEIENSEEASGDGDIPENEGVENSEMINDVTDLQNVDNTQNEYHDDEEYTEHTIYELDTKSQAESSRVFGIPFMAVTVICVVILCVSVIRRRKEKKDEARFIRRINNAESSRKDTARKPFADSVISGSLTGSDTVCHTYGEIDEDSGTRLLYQTREGVEITLEDRSDPTKYYRIHVRDSVVIGRNDRLCDIAINYDDSISSKHCELYSRDNRLYCRDLGSSNGTMINQQKVYQELPVESGDILRIGRLSFFVQIIGDSYE